jgi:hypothetical protein
MMHFSIYPYLNQYEFNNVIDQNILVSNVTIIPS